MYTSEARDVGPSLGEQEASMAGLTAEAGLVETVYGQITAVVRASQEEDMLAPTLTEWSVRELLFHQLLDAQRVLRALAMMTDREPDVDRVSYWQPFRPGVDPGRDAAHTQYVRASADAYAGSAELIWHWTDTAIAASRAALAADPQVKVETQGHVLTVPDFLSTIVVEATVHYLDLTVNLDAPAVDEAALQHTREVLDGLLGTALPAEWSDLDAVLKGTGRSGLVDRDHDQLGRLADRFPLLG